MIEGVAVCEVLTVGDDDVEGVTVEDIETVGVVVGEGVKVGVLDPDDEGEPEVVGVGDVVEDGEREDAFMPLTPISSIVPPNKVSDGATARAITSLVPLLDIAIIDIDALSRFFVAQNEAGSRENRDTSASHSNEEDL